MRQLLSPAKLDLRLAARIRLSTITWVLQKKPVTAPIIGATKPHHLEDAAAALEIRLTEEEIRRLEEPYVPHPVTGFA
ncbi:hypothetical protein PUR_27670 [Paenibacillus sp. URB8-2]|nr:hypothetical protein PUR_27670 [Paenibacillus sp. URB8-2]